MEIINDNNSKSMHDQFRDMHEYHNPRAGRVLAGFVLIGVGVVLLLRKMGVFMPHWIFTWPSILIVIGVYMGAKRLFRGFGWVVPIIVGLVFHMDHIIPGIQFKNYFWPVLFIIFGIAMIFKPKNSWKNNANCQPRRFRDHGRYNMGNAETTVSGEDGTEITSIFGGVERTIVNKDFKGGDITCVFGGAEVNLSQSDIKGEVVLVCNQVFGGVKIILPPNWKLQNEINVVFGGVEDKRPIDKDRYDDLKTIILRGNCVFGGIEIKSF